MITCHKTTDKELIKEIMTHPALFRLTYGQGIKAEDYEVDETLEYIVAFWHHEPVGLWSLHPVTALVVDAHIAMIPKYWGTEVIQKAMEAGYKYLKTETDYTKIFTSVPSNCFHMIKFCTRYNYKACGFIKDGIIYNNKLVDLLLFETDLYNEGT